MSKPATVARAPRGRPPHGAVTVGDYLSAPAGEAARAVRRAGLRPGLDRQVGHPAESVGLVMAQEPSPGETLPRGSMVTLYVAAPGGGGNAGEDRPDGQRDGLGIVEVNGPSAPTESAMAPRTEPHAPRRFSYVVSAGPAPADGFTLNTGAGWPNADRPPLAPQGRVDLGSNGSDADELPAPLDEQRDAPQASQLAAEEGWAEEGPGVGFAASIGNPFASPREARAGRLYPREPLLFRVRTALRWGRAHPAGAVAFALIAVWLGFALAHRTDAGHRPRREPVPPGDVSRARVPSVAQVGHRRRAVRARRRMRARTAQHAQIVLARAHPAPRPNVVEKLAPPGQPASAPAAAEANSGGGPFSP